MIFSYITEKLPSEIFEKIDISCETMLEMLYQKMV